MYIHTFSLRPSISLLAKLHSIDIWDTQISLDATTYVKQSVVPYSHCCWDSYKSELRHYCHMHHTQHKKYSIWRIHKGFHIVKVLSKHDYSENSQISEKFLTHSHMHALQLVIHEGAPVKLELGLCGKSHLSYPSFKLHLSNRNYAVNNYSITTTGIVGNASLFCVYFNSVRQHL